MNILITGIAGFIGSNLAERLLKEGHQVFGVDNLAYGVKEQIPQGVQFHKTDIRSKDIYSYFRKMETVFHLAAKNCITDCQADPVETSDINVTGTVNVFEACKRAGVKKVVYAESSALYEGSQKYPTPEEDEHIESFYAASKLAEKYFAQAYARFHRMNLTALRYFCVYGPRQDYRRSIPPVISAFILKLLKGERPVIYGDGKKRRDFVYVDDVNNFHVQCLKDPKTNGETFNLGSGENYSVREIYDAVESILKTGIQPEFRPDLPGESQITLADISKAGALGWKPKTTLKQGLKKSIEFIWEHVLQSPGIGRG